MGNGLVRVLSILRYALYGVLLGLFLCGTRRSPFVSEFLDLIGMTYEQWSPYLFAGVIGTAFLLLVVTVWRTSLKMSASHKAQKAALDAKLAGDIKDA